jgi:hypothetical protein
MYSRGDPNRSPRAFRGGCGVSRVGSYSRARLPIFSSTPGIEARTRQPVPPKLKLPGTPPHYGGLAVSVVLHGLLIGALVLHGERLWSRTISMGNPARSGSSSGVGGGGNRVAYITLPPLPRTESPPRFTVTAPVPVVKTVETPVAEPEPVPVTRELPEPAESSAVASGADTISGGSDTGGPGAGVGAGAGTVGGTGLGAGAGPGGGGKGGTLRPPEPRDMAFPFDAPPKELRGVSLNVTFWVRADGRVERYRVEPQIKDREYAKKFDEVMRAFRFTPARAANGTRVAGTTNISFTLPGKSSS